MTRSRNAHAFPTRHRAPCAVLCQSSECHGKGFRLAWPAEENVPFLALPRPGPSAQTMSGTSGWDTMDPGMAGKRGERTPKVCFGASTGGLGQLVWCQCKPWKHALHCCDAVPCMVPLVRITAKSRVPGGLRRRRSLSVPRGPSRPTSGPSAPPTHPQGQLPGCVRESRCEVWALWLCERAVCNGACMTRSACRCVCVLCVCSHVAGTCGQVTKPLNRTMGGCVVSVFACALVCGPSVCAWVPETVCACLCRAFV